ncbi:MAG TPA: Ig-like domain-containing protein [Gemmatimonadales bacterium]|nr:Ig-like domain-containing protein [Gemmatimonadales bacterium]
MVPLRLFRRVIVPLSVSVLVGCNGGDLVIPPDEPADIEVVNGNGQVGTAGLPLEQPVMVRLVDATGKGVPNHPVSWVVSGGGGRATPETSMTDEEGLASVTWILGPTAGPNTLDAVVSDVGRKTISAMAAGGDDDGGGTGGGGTGGGGTGGATLPSPAQSTVTVDVPTIVAGGGAVTITIVVRDENGNPVAGVSVLIQATGEGNLLTQPAPTDASGIATGTLSSTTPGTKIVSVTVGGTLGLTQTVPVTVTPGPAAAPNRLELLEGNDQSAIIGSNVSVRPAVRLTTPNGEAVSGARVEFVVTGGGGTITGATQTTDSNGVARVGSWTLATGVNTLQALVESARGSPVVFTARGLSGETRVNRLIFLTPPPREVRVNEAFTVRVALVDERGDIVPLSGIFTYIGLFEEGREPPNNTRLYGERFENTDNGVAAFNNIKVTAKGTYRLRALTDDLPALGPHGPEPWLYSDWFEVK